MATRRSTRQRKRKAEQDQEPSLPAEDSDPDNLSEEQDSDSDADGDVAMSASTASRRAPSTRKSKRRKAEVSYDGDPDSDSNDDNEDDSDDDKDDGLCVCGGGEDAGPMIGCDGCQSWLHLACVGLSESSPELEAEQYFCPDCYRAQQEPKHKTKKPTKTKRKRSSTSASSKRSKTLSSSSSSSSSSTPTDLAAKLKKLPAKEIREMLERRGEMHARRSKKPEMVRHLVQLRVGLPNPEAMALVVNSESLLDLILRFVDAPDLFQCARVSRRWARAAVRPELWIPFLDKWGRLVRVPDGFGRAATADVLAAAYLNHYETGQMGVSSYCKCVLEPTDAQRTSLKDLAYVHEPTQTWFALTTCASCDRYQLGPADAQSRYRIRFKDTELEPEVTTTWWRHHPTHHYRFEGLEMQRYAAAKYGGATNIRRYSRWKSLGGKVADKPAFAYDTDKMHEWDWAKPPRVVKLPGSIVAISTAPIVRAAVADLHKRGVIRTKTDAAWSLAEDGLFECLEEGCSVRMDPDNEVYWSNKKLICAQGRCAEHCSGGELCAYHDALAHKDALAQNMLALPAPSEFAPNTKSALRNNAWVKLRKADYRACKTCWEVGSTRKFSAVATVVDDEPLCVKHGLEERFGDNLPSGLSAARARKLLLNSASLCVTCFAAGKTTAISDHPACDKCRDCCLEARGKDQPEAHRWYYIVPEGTCTHWLPLREIVNCAAGYDAAQRLKAMTGHDLLAWDEAHGRAESGEICRWCFDSQRITDSFDGASGLCGDHALSKWYSASEAKTLSDDQKVRVIEAGRRACLKCLKDDDEVVVTSVCTKHLCRSCCLSASLEDTMLHSSRGGQKHLKSGKWCTHWKPLSEFVTLADVGLTARQPRPEGLPSYSYWSSRLGPSARWLESARAQDGHHWTAQMRIAKRKLKKEQLCLECLGAGQLTNKSRLPCKEHSSGEVPKKGKAKKGKAKKGKN